MKLHLIAVTNIKYSWEDRYTKGNPNAFLKIDQEVGNYISFKVFEGQSASGGVASAGIVDKNGKEIILPKYINTIDLESLVEGKAVEVIRFNENKELIYGILSPEFKEIVPCKFNHLYYFSTTKEKEFLKVQLGEKYGLYDAKTFKLLLEPIYSSIRVYARGHLGIIEKDRKIGFVDHEGNLLIEPKYDEIADFYGSDLHGKLIIVIKDNLRGIVNTEGIEIVPLIYSQIEESGSDLIPVKKEDSGWGLINTSGKLITPLKFSRDELIVGRPKDRRFRVWQEYEDTFDKEPVKQPSFLNKLKNKLKSI